MKLTRRGEWVVGVLVGAPVLFGLFWYATHVVWLG